jgi:biotin-[acetyl-CoA-carboxylase] ligase BirA-like protein
LAGLDAGVSTLLDRLFPGESVYQNTADVDEFWTHAFLVSEAPSSQFDVLVELIQTLPEMPGGVICLAGSGHDFHGQRNRHWVAMKGNIHLTVYMAPRKKVERFDIGFPVLAAVSIVETIDSIEGLKGKASIKWVNDVLCNEAKVAGFLVHTASMEETVSSVILGMGLNVEKTPELPPDPHVPKVSSLREVAGEHVLLNQKEILSILFGRLRTNYELLCEGQWKQLLQLYRKRSLVVGRNVRIMADPEDGSQVELGAGKVFSIGENLELWLDGADNPVKKGRLILID